MEKKIKIFVVDDDPNIRRDFERRLGFRQVDVKAFATARALLNQLGKLKPGDMPTAVLIDYVLKEMGGERLIQEILKLYPRLPIIVVSGLDIQGSIRAYGMGAYAIMQKPLDYNELMITLIELTNLDEIAMRVARDLSGITEFSCCLVWQLDRKDYPKYKITGWTNLDRDFVLDAQMQEKDYPRLKNWKRPSTPPGRTAGGFSGIISHKNGSSGWLPSA